MNVFGLVFGALALALLTLQPAPIRAEVAPASPEVSTASGNLHEIAAQELNTELHQRYLGIVPDFYTMDGERAAPLSASQKTELALRSEIDPSTLVNVSLVAILGHVQHDFRSYGQGFNGYRKRITVAYADDVSSMVLSGILLPVVFHQDPRYFRKGKGSIVSRTSYAFFSSFRCKDDRGRWVPNYSNLVGNLAVGVISNAYYPRADRGFGLTLSRAVPVSLDGTVGTLIEEFWPDIQRHLFHHRAASGASDSQH